MTQPPNKKTRLVDCEFGEPGRVKDTHLTTWKLNRERLVVPVGVVFLCCMAVARCLFNLIYVHMGVSKNNGTPKSSILIGFSIINHPFRGTRIFGNTHMYFYIERGFSMFHLHHVHLT